MQQTFINYNNATDEEVRLYISAGLVTCLKDAYDRLFPYSERKRLDVYSPWQLLKLEKKDLDFVNSRIEYILELIARYRYPEREWGAVEQHVFFSGTAERVSFSTHLFVAIQLLKEEAILPSNEQAKDEVDDAVHAHLAIKKYENKRKFFEIEGKALSEDELYAAAAVYNLNFALEALKAGDIMKLSSILCEIYVCKTSPDYTAALRSLGGLKSAKARSANKERAYRVFSREKVFETHGSNHDAMYSTMIKLLRDKKITFNQNTLRAHWITEFRERYKADARSID